MDEFLKDLYELCKKHNIYITGSGLIDLDWLCAIKANSVIEIENDDYGLLEDKFIKLTADGYKIIAK